MSKYLDYWRGEDLIQARNDHFSTSQIAVIAQTLEYFRSTLHSARCSKKSNALSPLLEEKNNWQFISYWIGKDGLEPIGKYTYVLQELEIGMKQHSFNQPAVLDREKIDQIIEDLHGELGANHIDEMVNIQLNRAKDAPYAVQNRYKDLEKLSNAVIDALNILVKKYCEKLDENLELDQLYTKLYEKTGKPPVNQEPAEWMQEHALYYVDELKKVIVSSMRSSDKGLHGLRS